MQSATRLVAFTRTDVCEWSVHHDVEEKKSGFGKIRYDLFGFVLEFEVLLF